VGIGDRQGIPTAPDRRDRPGVRPALTPGYWLIVPAFGTIFVVGTTIGFLAPLLIALSNDLGTTLAEVAQLVVVTAVAWAVAAPFTGLITDRFGRRPVLVLCLLGMAATTFGGALVSDFRLLLLLRLLTGLFGSGAPPSILGGISDLYPPHRRGRAIGFAQSGFSFATLLGVPLVGAIGGLWGWRASFAVIGGTLLAASLFVRLTFPAGRPGGSGAGNPLHAYRHLFRLPNLGTLLLANVFERITFMAVSLYFASFLIQTYDLTPVTVAPALALAALGAIVGTIAGGFGADRYSRPALAALGLGVSAIFGGLTFGWPVHLFWSVIAGFGFGLANALSRPAHFSLVLGLSDRHRGAMVGLIAFSNQAGWALGAASGGVIIGLAGFGGLGGLILVFGLAAAGLIGSLLLGGRRAAGHRPLPRQSG
jgi:predicted MFS family arabinose efflux permease